MTGVQTCALPICEHLRREHGIAVVASETQGAALADGALADVAASFQEAVVDMLVAPTIGAARELGVRRIVVSGGVSANSRLRHRMQEEGAAGGFEVHFSSPRFCTDNAAMIAYAGARRLEAAERDELTLNAAASLPL